MFIQRNWKIFGLLLLAAAAPAAAAFHARFSLPGGAPAAGFVVSVIGQPISATATNEGVIVLDPEPLAPFQLVATGADGSVYQPVGVDAVPAEALVVELVPVASDSVLVVSGIAPGIDRLPAGAAAVVTADAFEQRPVPKVALALESIAGAGKLDGGADGVPSLRGLARGRTVVLIDGTRVSAERRAGPSATCLDPAALASLEVVRGPGSVVYGSDAFGGVINAVTRDPEPGGFRFHYDAESFSEGLREWSGYLSAGGDLGGGALFVDAHAGEADDWIDGNGDEVYSSGFEAAGASLRYLHPVGPGRLRASLLVDRGENVDKPAIDSRANTASYPTEDSDRFQLSWVGDAPGETFDALDSALLWSSYQLILDRERQPGPTTTRRLDTSDVDADDLQWRTVLGGELGGGRLQLGLDVYSRLGVHAIFDRTSYDAAGEQTAFVHTIAIDDASQWTEALFATWTRGLGERLSLALGGRGDFVQSENRGGFYGDRSEDVSAFSGNAALTVALAPGWQVVGQLASGFRVPTLSDRYFVGPSGRGLVFGNPDLKEETSLQADLSLRYGRERTSAALYLYRYDIDDLVERYGAGDNFRFRNRGEATIEGIEVEAQTAVGESWSFDLGAAWAEGEADGVDPLADISAPNGWVGARWTSGAFSIHGRATVVGSKDEPGPAERARPSYELFDLGASWRAAEAFELRLLVRNLADEYYIAAADELAAPSPGRTIQLGVSGRF